MARHIRSALLVTLTMLSMVWASSLTLKAPFGGKAIAMSSASTLALRSDHFTNFEVDGALPDPSGSTITIRVDSTPGSVAAVSASLSASAGVTASPASGTAISFVATSTTQLRTALDALVLTSTNAQGGGVVVSVSVSGLNVTITAEARVAVNAAFDVEATRDALLAGVTGIDSGTQQAAHVVVVCGCGCGCGRGCGCAC